MKTSSSSSTELLLTAWTHLDGPVTRFLFLLQHENIQSEELAARPGGAAPHTEL